MTALGSDMPSSDAGHGLLGSPAPTDPRPPTTPLQSSLLTVSWGWASCGVSYGPRARLRSIWGHSGPSGTEGAVSSPSARACYPPAARPKARPCSAPPPSAPEALLAASWTSMSLAHIKPFVTSFLASFRPPWLSIPPSPGRSQAPDSRPSTDSAPTTAHRLPGPCCKRDAVHLSPLAWTRCG